jgi:predicted DNA-binding WGR domain protein
MEYEYYLENKTDGHRKFWSIHWTSGKSTTTIRYGKLGTQGAIKIKENSHSDNLALINKKLRKGYVRVETKKLAVEEQSALPSIKINPCLEIL